MHPKINDGLMSVLYRQQYTATQIRSQLIVSSSLLIQIKAVYCLIMYLTAAGPSVPCSCVY